MPPLPERLARLAPWLLTAALLAWVCGPALLSPASEHLGTEFIDTHGTLWFFWWVDHALRTGEPLMESRWLFHPWGKDLYAHTGGNVLDGILALPLRRLLGPVAGYNAWCLTVLLGNMVATAALARGLGAGRRGLWLAACLGLLHPFALRELALGRPTQALLAFLVGFMACLCGPPSWRRGVVGGLCLGLAGLSYWYYGLLGGLLGLSAAAWRLLVGPRSLAELVRLGLAGGLGLALVLPAAWPMLQGLEAGEVPGLLALGPEGGPLGRLLLLTVEGDSQGLTVMTAAGWGGLIMGVDELTVETGAPFLLLGTLLGAAVALRASGSQRLLAVTWCVLLYLVATGPAFVLGETLWPNPAYQLLVENLDVVRRWWWPARAAGPLVAVLAALAGLGLTVLPERWRWPAAGALALGAIVQLGLQGGAPLGSWSAEVGPGIRCLADEEGAVIELPWEGGQRPLYHQSVHERPQLNGMLITKEAFVPPELRELFATNGLLQHLRALGGRLEMRHLETVDPGERDALLDLGYRFVVFRLETFERLRTTARSQRVVSDWSRVRRLLRPGLGEPAHEDEHVAIYRLDGGSLDCDP